MVSAKNFDPKKKFSEQKSMGSVVDLSCVRHDVEIMTKSALIQFVRAGCMQDRMPNGPVFGKAFWIVTRHVTSRVSL